MSWTDAIPSGRPPSAGEALREARRRWGDQAYVEQTRPRGDGEDVFIVGAEAVVFGVGNSWAAAFEMADRQGGAQ